MSDRRFVSCASVIALTLAGAVFAGGNPACPNPEHDCFTTGTPGCSDEVCCNLVCDVDCFCCPVFWDSFCVSEAESTCKPGPVCNDCCPTDLNFDGVTDGADLGLLLSCWGPVLRGCECADFNGDGAIDGADLGLLLATWGPCPSQITCACQAADHNCCVIGGPGCTDLSCCEAVCAVDPFCCENAWTLDCTQKAATICEIECPDACRNSNHDCCATGGPGCSDLACCNAVCVEDALCCVAAWDASCVGEAETICGLMCIGCGVTAHDCCVQGPPGCSDAECCEAVCAVDSFCCEVLWDGICVRESFTICGLTCIGCGLTRHDCCTKGPSGCADAACCEAVCAVDSFCCMIAWDDVCVGEARTICDLDC